MGTSSGLGPADLAWVRAQAAAKSQAVATADRKLAEAAVATAVAVQADITVKLSRTEAAQRLALQSKTAAQQAAADAAAQLGALQAQIAAARPQRKTADFMALPNIPYLIDTTAGPISISIYPSLARDDVLLFEDVAGACDVHPATLLRGAYTIDGDAADYVIETPKIPILGRFDGATINIRRAA